MKIFVLSYEANQYDQYGKYFICFFQHKPTYEQLYSSLKGYVSAYKNLTGEKWAHHHNDRRKVVTELMTKGEADTFDESETFYLQEIESNN